MYAPRGLGFMFKTRVGADHDGVTLTRHSRTVFKYICEQHAVILDVLKKQTSYEIFSFDREFFARKHFCEYISGIQYKLCMMVITVDEPAYIFGDNNYVLCSTTIMDYMLKKKLQSIVYNLLKGGAATDE